MTETLAYGYSSERTQRELPNKYQHDRVKMVSKSFTCPYASDESSMTALQQLRGLFGSFALNTTFILLVGSGCTHFQNKLF